MEVLSQLIALRQKVLKKETFRDAVVATAITALKSIRAATASAKKTASPKSYTVEKTDMVGGWRKIAGKFTRVALRDGHQVDGIFPVNLAGQQYVKGERIFVWRIRLNNRRIPWKDGKNRRDRCYYVMARSAKVASDYGKSRVQRLMNKYRGTAKQAWGYAMAHLSTKPVASTVSTGKASSVARNAIQVMASTIGDEFVLTIVNNLSHARSAMRKTNIDDCLKKAANSIAGMLRKTVLRKGFDQKIETPFPEVKKK
jgi:hypothetical protein